MAKRLEIVTESRAAEEYKIVPYNELKISGLDDNATEEDNIANAQALIKLRNHLGLAEYNSVYDLPIDAFKKKIASGEVNPYDKAELDGKDKGDAYIAGYKYEIYDDDPADIWEDYAVWLLIVKNDGSIEFMQINCQTDTDGVLKVTNSSINKGVTYHLFLAGSLPSTQPTTSNTTASGYTHQHAYEWKVLTDPTIDQDGVYAYMCSCGDIREKQPISAAQVFVKELYGKVKEAPQNGTVIYDAKSWSTISDYVLKKMAERNDVAVTIRFNYQKTAYEITFPAGTDYTTVLNDTETMYGFFGIAKLLGLNVKAV